MEAFGRMIAVTLAILSLVFSLIFYKTASLRWQKEETVRSMTQTYAEELLEQKRVSQTDWEAFREQLDKFGNYKAELTVYERRRFEGENGRLFLYTEWSAVDGERFLTEGSYVRIVVTEEEKENLLSGLFGTESVFFAGGRVS